MSAACLVSASAVATTAVGVVIRRTSGLVVGTGGVHFHWQPLIFSQKAVFVAVSHWTAMPLQVDFARAIEVTSTSVIAAHKAAGIREIPGFIVVDAFGSATSHVEDLA